MEVNDVMDNIRDSSGSLAAWNCLLLYDWRIHPYLACNCARNTCNSTHYGKKADIVSGTRNTIEAFAAQISAEEGTERFFHSLLSAITTFNRFRLVCQSKNTR